MKKLTLLLPDDLHGELVKWAKEEKRSLHAQLLWIVQQALNTERAATTKESL
jgi:hypothetical protein